MDIYALTSKKRPTTLTMGGSEPSSRQPSLSAMASSTGSISGSSTSTAGTPRAAVLREAQGGRIVGKEGTLVTGGGKVGFADVTMGPPTRRHWKPDSSATNCAHPTCNALFGLFERRHHCRRCGNLFCGQHCARFVRLDQDAQFDPSGTPSKACDACTHEADKWAQRRRSNVTSSGKNAGEAQEGAAKGQPKRTTVAGTGPQGMEGVTELGREDIVRPQPEGIKIASSRIPEPNFNPTPSVPADWQWSTF